MQVVSVLYLIFAPADAHEGPATAAAVQVAIHFALPCRTGSAFGSTALSTCPQQ